MKGARTLWGLAEIAENLGVSKTAVQNWMKEPDFPEPRAKLKMGPAFYASDVRTWRRRKLRARRR